MRKKKFQIKPQFNSSDLSSQSAIKSQTREKLIFSLEVLQINVCKISVEQFSSSSFIGQSKNPSQTYTELMQIKLFSHVKLFSTQFNGFSGRLFGFAKNFRVIFKKKKS